MEISTVTNTGYVKIPNEILKNLNLKNGSRVSFVKEGNRIIIDKADAEIVDEESKIMLDELKAAYNEKLATEHNVDENGISDEDREIVKLVKEVRAELWEKRYAHND